MKDYSQMPVEYLEATWQTDPEAKAELERRLQQMLGLNFLPTIVENPLTPEELEMLHRCDDEDYEDLEF